MSSQIGWNINGKRFVKSGAVNGRTIYHIEGKIVSAAVFAAEIKAAKAAEAAKGKGAGQ